MTILEQLSHSFSNLDMIDAFALSGSATSPINDNYSDYDLYVYSSADVPREARKAIIERLSSEYSVGNSFFEEGDEFFVQEPKRTAYDLMYRRINWVTEEIDWTWNKHNARLGYTTCFLYNLKTSQILFDRSNKLANLLKPLEEPYPEELKEHIIEKNHIMLRGPIEAPYLTQLRLAVYRNDLVSQNHRLAGLLASYFDILFAYNKQLHPGEKKLMAYAHLFCEKLPRDFDRDIEAVIGATGEQLLDKVQQLLDHLDEMLIG